MQKGVLRNFTKFTGKHLCQSHLGLLFDGFFSSFFLMEFIARNISVISVIMISRNLSKKVK